MTKRSKRELIERSECEWSRFQIPGWKTITLLKDKPYKKEEHFLVIGYIFG